MTAENDLLGEVYMILLDVRIWTKDDPNRQLFSERVDRALQDFETTILPLAERKTRPMPKFRRQ